jgi:hypothetical protein
VSGTARGPSALLPPLACAVAALLGVGCARLVTVDPASVSKLNDETWNIRSVPRPAAAALDAATVVQPLPFARRAEVARALRAPPDALGIPADLYAVDPLLSSHRREMESQASARHQVGAGLIVSSLVVGGLSAWAVAWGSAHTGSADPQTASSASQLFADGVILGAVSVGELIAGIALAASSSDAAPLQRYYRETYVAPR